MSFLPRTNWPGTEVKQRRGASLGGSSKALELSDKDRQAEA